MQLHVLQSLGDDPEATVVERGLDPLQSPVKSDDEVQAAETHARARHPASDAVGHPKPGDVV